MISRASRLVQLKNQNSCFRALARINRFHSLETPLICHQIRNLQKKNESQSNIYGYFKKNFASQSYQLLSLPNVLNKNFDVGTKDSSSSNIKLAFTLNPQEIDELSKEIISRSQRLYDEIGSLRLEECTFESVICKLGHLEDWITTHSASCYFPLYVSPSQEVRAAATAAYQELSNHRIESSMREDIYKAVIQAKLNFESKSKANNYCEEDLRLMNKMIEDYNRLGFHLPTKEREQLSLIFKELSELSNRFSNNIAEDKTTIAFTRKELKGLPDFYFSSVKNLHFEQLDKEPLYEITMKYPDIEPIMENAKDPEVRRKTELVYASRCEVNIKLMERALVLREQAAKLLGYETHADYQLAVRMAQTPSKVFDFLNDLNSKLTSISKLELNSLLELKLEEEPNATSVQSWDLGYYKNKLLQKEHSVNQTEIQEYFPSEHVVSNMFAIFEELFSVKFNLLKNHSSSWSEGVDFVEVVDNATNKVVGGFYVDMYPRDGKFTHAACFPLQPGCLDSEGVNQIPVVGMVCNFTKPCSQTGRPSLLRHYEVITLFHELGHVLHCVLSNPKWGRFSGVNVEHDFVETPSQLLENWCWEPSMLKRLSRHYSTGKSLPDSLIESLIGSRKVGTGLFHQRQVVFGLYDMKLHTAKDASSIDSVEMMNQTRQEILGIKNQHNTFPSATFNHIMGGYDAGYYGYLWSLVYAKDIYYEKLCSSNPDYRKNGIEYKNKILAKGGSRDGFVMLRDLLGREPSSEAFFKSILN